MRRNQAQIDRVVLYQNRAQFILNLGKLALFIRGREYGRSEFPVRMAKTSERSKKVVGPYIFGFGHIPDL